MGTIAMIDALINATLLVALILAAVAFWQFETWIWRQVALSRFQDAPDITEGMPKWLARRIAARERQSTPVRELPSTTPQEDAR